MSVMNNLAKNFLLDNGINNLQMDLSFLKRLCDKLNYELLSYSQGEEIINRYELNNYTNKRGFTFICADIKIIFYKDSLSYSDKIFTISHEIGHIVLKHTYHGILGFDPDNEVMAKQELEATEFAYSFLAPCSVLNACKVSSTEDIEALTLLDGKYAEHIYASLEKYKRTSDDLDLLKQYEGFIKKHTREHKRNLKKFVLASVVVLLLLGGIIFAVSSGIFSPDTNANEIVYVTKDGSKYHLRNCEHIQGRDTIELRLSSAEESGYMPCLSCRPYMD